MLRNRASTGQRPAAEQRADLSPDPSRLHRGGAVLVRCPAGRGDLRFAVSNGEHPVRVTDPSYVAHRLRQRTLW